MWISLYLPWKTFLKMTAELTPCAKAVSTALLRSHNLPSSSFQLKHFFFLLIKPLVNYHYKPVWLPSSLSHHFHLTLALMLSFQYLSESQMPLWRITRPHLVKESVSKEALLHLSGPTYLKKASDVHSTEKKLRLTRGEEIKKSCSPIFAGSLHSPWKGKW